MVEFLDAQALFRVVLAAAKATLLLSEARQQRGFFDEGPGLGQARLPALL
jgi:hypothetical protein